MLPHVNLGDGPGSPAPAAPTALPRETHVRHGGGPRMLPHVYLGEAYRSGVEIPRGRTRTSVPDGESESNSP
jgi:hypothetical protein